MSGFARSAVVLSLSRIANYGLMIISPVILVRFLSVRDFGHYREFLLYASLLQSVAGFSISDALLYFIPAHPNNPWRFVRETNVLTAMMSAAVVGGTLVLNFLTGGKLLGPYAIPVALYVMFYVNVDFWEGYWLAMHRPSSVFAYMTGRLMLRLLVVVGVAVLTSNVATIIWSLIALEGLRLAVSTVAWTIADRAASEPRLENIRRDQLRFCVPVGLATVCYIISRNLGNLAVAKYLGAAALAQFTIGTYGEPIVMALRSSLSTVVLPELVRRGATSRDALLLLWQRTTVINCVLLFPAAVVAVVFAEPVIVKAFGVSYRPAVPILQLYALVIIRSCFDFSPPLRAVNKTRPLVTSNIAAALGSAVTLIVLLPLMGIVGAGVALVISNLLEAVYLAWSVKRIYRLTWTALLPWKTVARVTLCALVAGAPIAAVAWRVNVGLMGVALWSACSFAIFCMLLVALRIEEPISLMRRLKAVLASFFP
jgi:O-antigen/teichoic acid export membrane protein